MLCEGKQGVPDVWLWIGVDDTDGFFAEFSAKGVLEATFRHRFPTRFNGRNEWVK